MAQPGTSVLRSAGLRSRALGAALLLLLGACASLESEKHLAPLFTQMSPAGGGSETELLGGALRSRSDAYTGRTVEWAFRPFFSLWPKAGSDYQAYAIPPLGSFRREGFDKTWQLLPLFRYDSRVEDRADGRHWTWSLLALPGIYLARNEEGRRVNAWFPIIGSTEDFFSFDEIEFFLFPLWARTRRRDRVEYHFLWPFFGWTNADEGRSFRIWPLIGRNKWNDHYDRWFFLWPFLHWQQNRQFYGEDQQEDRWMVWPFLGRSERAGYTSTTVLWPFFGYASHEDNGFWALDGPWPFVRILRPGDTGGPERTRFWPFYSHYRGDGLDSTWYLWPFVNRRSESYGERKSQGANLLPFWRSEDDWVENEQGERTDERRFRKLWPLYQTQDSEDSSYLAFPALNPFWRMPVIDYHYAWLWQLFTSQSEDDRVSQRAWLGLWRREADADEDRHSISGLYAARSYTKLGQRVVDRSLLFGLLRWRRTEGGGFELLRPALPGPGWPIDRVPNSILPTLPAPEAEPDPEAEEI